MNQDDYEDEGESMMLFAQPGQQVAKFLVTDVIFVVLRCTANIVDEFATGLGFLSNIAAGHANYRRMKDNQAQMRGSLEDDLAALSGQEDV